MGFPFLNQTPTRFFSSLKFSSWQLLLRLLRLFHKQILLTISTLTAIWFATRTVSALELWRPSQSSTSARGTNADVITTRWLRLKSALPLAETTALPIQNSTPSLKSPPSQIVWQLVDVNQSLNSHLRLVQSKLLLANSYIHKLNKALKFLPSLNSLCTTMLCQWSVSCLFGWFTTLSFTIASEPRSRRTRNTFILMRVNCLKQLKELNISRLRAGILASSD